MFLCGGFGLGAYSQNLKGGTLKSVIECRYGNVNLRRITLGVEASNKAFSSATVATSDGKQVPCTISPSKNTYRVELQKEVVVGEGQSVIVTLTGSGHSA